MVKTNKPAFIDSIEQVKSLTKSSSVRSRLLLRFLLMKKQSAAFVDYVADNSASFYTENSIFAEENSFTEFYGLLLSLEIIDINFCLKDVSKTEHIHKNLVWYLSPCYLAILSEQTPIPVGEPQNLNLVDQKTFLELENRRLLDKKIETEDLLKVQEKISLAQKVTNDAYQNSLEKMKSDLEMVGNDKHDLERQVDLLKSEVANSQAEQMILAKTLETETKLKNELQLAVSILETDVENKKSELHEIKLKNAEQEAMKNELFEKYSKEKAALVSESTHLNDLRDTMKSMRVTMTDYENQIRNLELKNESQNSKTNSLNQQISALNRNRESVISDLEVERDWRQKLQRELNLQRENLTAFEETKKKLTVVENNFTILKDERNEAFMRIKELEQSLDELGQKFQSQAESHDKVQDFIRPVIWADDDEYKNCPLCEAKFSISKRKHHCRNCGKIFCAKCSNNYKATHQFSKPVRVCDNCTVNL